MYVCMYVCMYGMNKLLLLYTYNILCGIRRVCIRSAVYTCNYVCMCTYVCTVCIGELLTVLITLDGIVRSNEPLNSAWAAFKSMVAFIRGIYCMYVCMGYCMYVCMYCVAWIALRVFSVCIYIV